MNPVICLCGSDNGYNFAGFKENERIHHCACGLKFTYDAISNSKISFTKIFILFSDKYKFIKVSYGRDSKKGYGIEASYYIETNLWRAIINIISNIEHEKLFVMSSEELTNKIEKMMILV